MYVYLFVALVAAFGAGTAAWNIQAWRFDSKLLTMKENQQAIERMRRQNSNTAAVAHEVAKTAIQTKFAVITEKVEHEIAVEKLVYSSVCIAPGGLQQLADSARATGYTGEPGDTVPAATPAK